MLPSEVQSYECATSNENSVMMREVGMFQRNENTKHARTTNESFNFKVSLTRKGETSDISENPKALGHPSESITCAPAYAEGILLKEKFNPCKHCTVGKARQANIRKKEVFRSTNS